MKIIIKRILLVTIFALFFIISGCDNESEYVNNEIIDDKVVVGVITPLSGDYSFFGQTVKDSINMAKDKYPNSNIEFIFEDDESCKINNGLSSLYKLINIDDADLIINTCSDFIPAFKNISDENSR